MHLIEIHEYYPYDPGSNDFYGENIDKLQSNPTASRDISCTCACTIYVNVYWEI